MLNQTHIRKIWRDISERKSRSALVIISVFISVLGVIAFLTMGDLITRQLKEDVKPEEIAMIDIKVALRQEDEVDNSAVLDLLNHNKEFEALESITIAEGRANFFVKFRHPHTNEIEEAELRSSSTHLAAIQIEPIRLIEGDWPAIGQQEVAVEKRFADAYGFQVQDQITLIVGEKTTDYKIVGLIFDPYSYKRPQEDGSISPGPIDGIYIQFDDLKSLLDIQGFNHFVIRYQTFEQAQTYANQLQQIIREQTPYLPKSAFIENPEENGQVVTAQTFSDVLALLAAISMIVSGFLVVNVVNTIVVEQKQQIGIMKAIGASRLDNFIIYGGITLIYGLIGTALAIIPSIIAGYQFSSLLAPQLDILLEDFSWSLRAIAIGTILGILVPVIAAAFPIYNGTRVSIIDALIDLGISSGNKTSNLTLLIGRLPLPIIIRQGLSNIFQKKGRLILTGLTLTSALAAFMGVIAMTGSLNQAVQDTFDRVKYHITIIPTNLRDNEQLQQIASENEHIIGAYSGVILNTQINDNYVNTFNRNNQVITYGLDPTNYMYELRLQEGKAWHETSNQQGIIITTSMANQLDTKIGDTLDLTINGQNVTREVIGIDDSTFDFIGFKWDELAALGGYFLEGPQPNTYSEVATIEEFSGFTVAVGLSDEGAVVLGGQLLEANSIWITEAIAEDGNFSIDDSLTITIQGTTIERTITHIIPQSDFEALMQQQEQSFTVPNVLFFDFEDLVEVSGVELGQTPIPNSFYVVTDLDNPTAKNIDDIIDSLKEDFASEGIYAEFQNQIERSENVTALIVQYTAILSIAAILIGAVGAIGLLTTLTINVLERQKEIGVMRSIGASSYTVALHFLVEGLLVGFLAWIVAIPVSYSVAILLKNAFQLETIEFNYPPLVLVLGFLIMLVITSLASIIPAINAARKTVSEILRYQ